MTTIFFSEFFMSQKVFQKFPDSTSYLLSESSRFNIRCCFRKFQVPYCSFLSEKFQIPHQKMLSKNSRFHIKDLSAIFHIRSIN